MVRDRDGRLKGFGYAEFTSVHDLIEALKLNKMVCVCVRERVERGRHLIHFVIGFKISSITN